MRIDADPSPPAAVPQDDERDGEDSQTADGWAVESSAKWRQADEWAEQRG